MTFSIRTFLVVIAIVACWLGAFVSKSAWLVELTLSASILLILLTLAFAIWDVRPQHRAFWTGFFVIAFGNLVTSHFLALHQHTSQQVAQLIMGAPSAPVAAVNYQTRGYAPAPVMTPVTVQGTAGPATSYAMTFTVPPSTQSIQFYQQQEAIRSAVPTLLSLVTGCLGGWLTLWISRRRTEAAKSSDQDTAPAAS